MVINNTNILLQLFLTPKVGPATIAKLIMFCAMQGDNQLVSDLEAACTSKTLDLSLLYNFSLLDFKKRVGLSDATARAVVAGLSSTTVKQDQERVLLEKHKIKLVTILDENYPTLLRHIYLPPPLLYVQGAPLEAQGKRLAVVGSRKATSYGHEAIAHVVPALIAQGWEIISGGALGADTMAHHEALVAGGQTTAILGSGLLKPYPESNTTLFRKICEQGGRVISSFSLQTRPERGTFPERNRIIAGMSQGCLVVQAAQRSGALITARHALESGRQVFALPGEIFHPLSAGCHQLLKQGAKLVSSVDDVLEEFDELLVRGQAVIPVKSVQQAIVEQESNPIVRALDGPTTFDELSVKTGHDILELQHKLFELQLDGRVTQNFTGSWERTHR